MNPLLQRLEERLAKLEHARAVAIHVISGPATDAGYQAALKALGPVHERAMVIYVNKYCGTNDGTPRGRPSH